MYVLFILSMSYICITTELQWKRHSNSKNITVLWLYSSQESSRRNTSDMHLRPMLNILYMFSLPADRTNSFNPEIYLVTGIRNTNAASPSCPLKSTAVAYKRVLFISNFGCIGTLTATGIEGKAFPESIFFYFFRTYAETKATSSSYLNNPKASTLTRQQDHRHCENDHLMLGTECEGFFVWAPAKSLPVADLDWDNLFAGLLIAGWGALRRILDNNQFCNRNQTRFVFYSRV